jgi:hypothetical protein
VTVGAAGPAPGPDVGTDTDAVAMGDGRRNGLAALSPAAAATSAADDDTRGALGLRGRVANGFLLATGARAASPMALRLDPGVKEPCCPAVVEMRRNGLLLDVLITLKGLV